jgi:hypothetical protein
MKNTPMNRQMITVATFDSLEAAEGFRRHLSTKVIHAVVNDERRVQRFWFLAPRRHGIHVRVLPELADIARTYLHDWERRMGLRFRAIHCPECDSSRVEYPQMARQFILPTLMAHIAILLGLQRRRYYCKDCHQSWDEVAEPGDKALQTEAKNQRTQLERPLWHR